MMDIRTIDFRQLVAALKKPKPVILWLDDERDPLSTHPDYFDCELEPGEYKPTWVESTVGKLNNSTTNSWEVVWVKNYKEFVNYIETHGLPDVVCFDHDLGEQKTGMNCAEYLVDVLLECDSIGPIIRCQSFNPSGAARILGLCNNWREHYVKEHPNQFK